MKNNFSRLTNSYLMDEAADLIYLTTESGEQYRMHPDFSLVPDSGNSDQVPETYRYEFAADYKINGKYNLAYALSCIDTLAGNLYILGSTAETSQVLDYFGVSISTISDEMRQLTTIPFNVKEDRIELSKTKPVTAEQKYVGGAFLLNKFYTSAWHGKNGEHLIIYRSGAGSKAALSLAMMDKTGKENWTYDTGMAFDDFNDYLIGESSLVLWMDEYTKGEQTQKAFFVNLEDGNTKIH
jgi:hypothetical protein